MVSRTPSRLWWSLERSGGGLRECAVVANCPRVTSLWFRRTGMTPVTLHAITAAGCPSLDRLFMDQVPASIADLTAVAVACPQLRLIGARGCIEGARQSYVTEAIKQACGPHRRIFVALV